MFLHIKATMDVAVRKVDDPMDAPEKAQIEVWSDGRPGAEIQIKIGDSLYVVDASEMLSAITRCSLAGAPQ